MLMTESAARLLPVLHAFSLPEIPTAAPRFKCPHFSFLLQINQLQEVMTWLMWAGIIPAAMAGAAISYFRLQFFTVILPDRFR